VEESADLPSLRGSNGSALGGPYDNSATKHPFLLFPGAMDCLRGACLVAHSRDPWLAITASEIATRPAVSRPQGCDPDSETACDESRSRCVCFPLPAQLRTSGDDIADALSRDPLPDPLGSQRTGLTGERISALPWRVAPCALPIDQSCSQLSATGATSIGRSWVRIRHEAPAPHRRNHESRGNRDSLRHPAITLI